MNKVNVLGTEYKIIKSTAEEDKKLKTALGYCDHTTKEIIIEDVDKIDKDEHTLGDLKVHESRVLRHEIIHAFLFESGLGYDTSCNWATNEEMIDYFARQIPKMLKVFQDIDIV